jgi:hypothetical protein
MLSKIGVYQSVLVKLSSQNLSEFGQTRTAVEFRFVNAPKTKEINDSFWTQADVAFGFRH